MEKQKQKYTMDYSRCILAELENEKLREENRNLRNEILQTRKSNEFLRGLVADILIKI